MKLTTLIVAAATAVAFPTLSSAETYFSCSQHTTEGTTISLGTITADSDGVVEVYEYRLGEAGNKIGETKLNAGANSNVRVTSTMPIRRDVIAMIKINGETVATKVFDVCED